MGNGLLLRPAVEQADIASLRDAYGKMQKIMPSDNRSWVYWAGYHGFNHWYCWHGQRHNGVDYPYDLFLPWHRAYLVYWNAAALAQNGAGVTPWWDWTTDASHQSGIPDPYVSDPESNPLATGPKPDMPADNQGDADPARPTRRSPDDPSQLPTADDVEAVLALSTYEDFTNQLQQIHNDVHGWCGGDMGIVRNAAFDPIFWAHHTMIDRIWYLWQLRHGVSNIPGVYLDASLEPWSYHVSDVLDIHTLGYDYVSSSAAAAGPSSSGSDSGSEEG